jgi:hypothetical protein
MKALLLIVALLPFTAFAEKLSFKTCTNFSNLAESVMTSRQLGFDIVKAYEIAGDNKAFQLLVTDAYSQPKFLTKAYRNNSISKFKNKYFLNCIN